MKIPRNVLILFFVFLLLVLVLGVLYYKQDEESYMPQPKPNLPTGTYALSMVVVDASNQNTNKLVTVSTDGNVVINPTIGPINRASQSGRNNITTPRTQSGFTNQRQNVWSNMYSWWFPSTKEGFATKYNYNTDTIMINGVAYTNPLLFLPPGYAQTDPNTFKNIVIGDMLTYEPPGTRKYDTIDKTMNTVSKWRNINYGSDVVPRNMIEYNIPTDGLAIPPPGFSYSLTFTSGTDREIVWIIYNVDTNGNINYTPGSDTFTFNSGTNTWVNSGVNMTIIPTKGDYSAYITTSGSRSIVPGVSATTVTNPSTTTTSPATTTTSPATTTTSPATTTTNPSMTRAAYTGGPTSFATISTFNIECFNVNADKWQSAAAQSAAAQSAATQSAATQSAATTPGTTTTSAATTSATTVPAFTVAPNSYMVSTTITFNIAGIGFATYDIWMNNGSNNSNIADSTSSFTCVTGSCSTCSILPNCQGIQVITASPVSTSNPTVSNPTPTGSNPTPTGSNYTNIRQMITSVEVTLNQNLYYTVWLILYDINGNIVAASCPNTIIQIVPSMINNPAAYLNYTFSSSYLLIGGGGGGGQGGTGGGGICGQGGMVLVSGSNSSLMKLGYVMVMVNNIVQTKPITGNNAIITYTYDSYGNINVVGGQGGAGGGSSYASGIGNNGSSGTDAQIACTDMDNFPIVAQGGSGGKGGQGGNGGGNESCPNNYQTNQGTIVDNEQRGWGGWGGDVGNNGQNGMAGFESLNLYYFIVTGGTVVAPPTQGPTQGPTQCPACNACPTTTTLSSSTLSTNNTIQYPIPFTYGIDPISTTSVFQSAFQTFLSSFVPNLTSAVNVTNVTNSTTISVQTSPQGKTYIKIIPDKIPTVIPMIELSNYPAWQFQFVVNTISSPTPIPSMYGNDTVSVMNYLYTQNEYQQKLMNPTGSLPTNTGTMKFGLPCNMVSSLGLKQAIQAPNSSTLQFMSSNTPPPGNVYPSPSFLNSPYSFSSSYNPAYYYQANDGQGNYGRIWTPVTIFETTDTNSASVNLGTWYMYLDNGGVFHGYYHDYQKSSQGSAISADWEQMNALQYNHNKYYTIYFFQTDGIIAMFDITDNMGTISSTMGP